MSHWAPQPWSINPFATKFVRPGRLPYLFYDEHPQDIVAQLEQQQWHGQIVGPHGTGKSTLLHSLTPHLKNAERNVELVVLTSEARPRVQIDRRWAPSTQLIVDGFEQLSWWQRRQLIRRCRKKDMGLLTTSHRVLHQPTLLRTQPSLALFRSIVAKLVADHDVMISASEIRECFLTHQPNVREMLFGLYDLVERYRQG